MSEISSCILGNEQAARLTNIAPLDILSNMNNKTEFGEFLAAARRRKGLTLRAVEEATGISNPYLSQLENGRIKQPSPVVLHKLSKTYEISYAMLLQGVGYPVPGISDSDKLRLGLYSRIGPVTEDEKEALIEYLDFLRSRRFRDR